MKKHIQKKLLDEITLTDEQAKGIDQLPGGHSPGDPLPFKKIPEDKRPFIRATDNRFYLGFFLKVDGQIKGIPEPDPILVYFHAAYMNYIGIEPQKKEVMEKIVKIMDEDMTQQLYNFFGTSCSCILLLFTALEAQINRSIPFDYIYKQTSPQNTKSFTKTQIEEYITFDTKVNKILPEITGKKSFSDKNPNKYKHLFNLKEFRNMIAHTRQKANENTYAHLYRRAFDFNYSETLDAVRLFCNYYNGDDFIVECPCSHEW